LLEGIGKLKPSVLHIDNANPAVISNWENESVKICELIKNHCTPGNVAALGMESADENVIRRNNINATPEEVMKAIEIINSIGSERGENGMPAFLPGLNFVYGLDGESKKTYKINFNFLKKVVEKGYLLRRINIRQVASFRKKSARIDKNLFKIFKRKVNEEINRVMLKKIIPKKTIMKDVFLEIDYMDDGDGCIVTNEAIEMLKNPFHRRNIIFHVKIDESIPFDSFTTQNEVLDIYKNHFINNFPFLIISFLSA